MTYRLYVSLKTRLNAEALSVLICQMLKATNTKAKARLNTAAIEG
jgi:hypothetical protein